MNRKQNKSSPFVAIIFIILVIVLLGVSFGLMLQINSLEEKANEIKAEYEKIVEDNDKLKYELGLALDEENIRRIAKEEFGLVDPRDEYYIPD